LILGRGREWIFFFLFATTSILVQGPTKPPIHWLLESLSLEVKHPECEADHLHLVSRLRMDRAILPPPSPYVFMVWCVVKYRIYLHGMVLA
jgi:hypothetical protein